MNKVVLIGRMTKDAELKFLAGNGTAVATITIAVDKRKKEDGADFIGCTVWGKTAENLANYTHKGSLIAVAGRINTRSYEAKDGTKRFIVEVVADEVQFLDKKTSSNIANNENKGDNEEMEPVDDGDIPF